MNRFIWNILLSLVILAILSNCAIGSQYVWKSQPEKQIVSNRFFDAEIKPACESSWGCESFSLYIRNKSNKKIEINWNKTLFINNGQTSGGFMFEGILFKDRNEQKLTDIIFQNGEFRKSIYPSNLVYFLGSWHHREMPSGNVGVYLSVVIDGKELNETLIVNLLREEINE